MPERRAELRLLADRLPANFAGRSVLEVACGTGYWTERIFGRARTVSAVDLSPEALDIARSKRIPEGLVTFHQADAMALPATLGSFEAAFVAFFWSHIARTEIRDFLKSIHSLLQPGAPVIVLDNLYVPESSTPISRRDANGDTFQQRALDGGAGYEVLKNFPGEVELREQVGRYGTHFEYSALTYYWLMGYRSAT
jgi:demethylmenaquinone methyltransferase/2-methoxy-6-polyprenyl-1,4-benzoquinol methylase